MTDKQGMILEGENSNLAKPTESGVEFKDFLLNFYEQYSDVLVHTNMDKNKDFRYAVRYFDGFMKCRKGTKRTLYIKGLHIVK